MTINSSNKNIIYPSGTTAARPTSVNNGFIYFNTTVGALQIYQNGSWYVLTNINAPGSPTSVTATNQGTGRAYNNGQASVAFTPATETFGFPATYTITPTPTTSPSTFSGTSSPIVVTGLASSTQYTYTATATNNTGTSSASSASSGVTATTVPQAPTINSVTSSGGNSAIITFTAGATGGSAISQYTITSSPSTTTQNTSSSPYTFTGLTLGTSYTFTVTATNANGTSTSATSSSVQIVSPDTGAMVELGMIKVYSDTNTISFTSIPSTYKDLQIRLIDRNSRALNGLGASIRIQFNNDSTGANYYGHRLLGDGTGGYASSYTGSTTGALIGESMSNSATGGNFSSSIIDIFDYSNTSKYKTIRTFGGGDTNTSNGNGVFLYSGLWQSTSAINQITLNLDYNWKEYSHFALYGIKG